MAVSEPGSFGFTDRHDVTHFVFITHSQAQFSSPELESVG
jgi:hypothetical protein